LTTRSTRATGCGVCSRTITTCTSAADIAGAMDVLEREQVDVLLTDLRLGNEDGMVLIDRALKMSRPPICIMMTAYGSVDVAVEAMKRGAYDFVTKPLNLDKVELLIARAVQSRKLEQENRALREQVDERYGLENIWGDSPALHDVLETIKQVAPSSANVLIEGESGTGKELAAHAIHNLSRRNKAKFVVYIAPRFRRSFSRANCSGTRKAHSPVPTNGASARFEQANGGTLFLDEIGEIDPSTQVKLLRVMSEERAFERVGGNQTLRADVRLIAATNKNLEQLVREENSATTFIFASTSCASLCRRCASEKKISRFWSADFCAIFARKTRNRFSTSCRMPWTRSLRTIGPATSASCAPQSSTASSWRQANKSRYAICHRPCVRLPQQSYPAAFHQLKRSAKRPARSICTRRKED
jgi:Response regulator containing CheY-like receiver, AAA-type ATPase, and DNA-binding domains